LKDKLKQFWNQIDNLQSKQLYNKKSPPKRATFSLEQETIPSFPKCLLTLS
jgi:hypothetical protein